MDIKHADRVVREKNYAISTSYDIHIDLDGGEGIDVLDYTYTVNDDIIINTHPTKVGYTFIGWTGTGIEVPQMEINIEKGTTVGDKTFTANWRRMQLRVVTPAVENSTLVKMIKVYDVDSEGKYVLKQTINHSTNLRSNDLTDIMSYTGIDKTFAAYHGGWVELYLKQNVEVRVVGDVKSKKYSGIYRNGIETYHPNVIKFKIPEDAYEDNAISTHFRHYQGSLIGETIYAGNKYSNNYPESGLWYANKDALGLITLSHDEGVSWVNGIGVVCDFYGNTL